MLLPFFLLATQIAGGIPKFQPPQGAETRPPVTRSQPVSVPQAQAAMVARFNDLVAAMHDFSNVYNSSHAVDARKAARVRKAWAAFEAAEQEYARFINRQRQ